VLEIALTKANSCLGIKPTAGAHLPLQYSLLRWWVIHHSQLSSSPSSLCSLLTSNPDQRFHSSNAEDFLSTPINHYVLLLLNADSCSEGLLLCWASAVLPGLLLVSWKSYRRSRKPDFVAHHRLSSLALVQVVVRFSIGSSVTRRERKERCCDAKWLLPGLVRGTDTGERGRGGRGRTVVR
jgi:hypothetical protein